MAENPNIQSHTLLAGPTPASSSAQHGGTADEWWRQEVGLSRTHATDSIPFFHLRDAPPLPAERAAWMTFIIGENTWHHLIAGRHDNFLFSNVLALPSHPTMHLAFPSGFL